MTWFGRHLPAIATVLVGASIVAALSALGLFQAWVSPDTASFIAAWASQAPLAEMRLPPYGGLASWVMASPAALALLPAVQVGLFLAASVWLVESLRRLEVSHSACLATGLALGGSNLVMLWGNALLPEMLGHAALLSGMAVVVEIAAGLPSLRRGAVAGVAVTLAWALRSSLLPFVVLLPLLLPALPHRVRHCARVTALLVVACLGPMLGWSAYRARQVGDFNVVSFGGFLMSGMSALMLTPALAERLPERDREVARAIIAGRTALEASGDAMAVPANSTGQRSFVSVAVFYFDVLARTHDAVLFGVVAKQRGADESWPAFNARMQRLALDTIRVAPLDYAAWVVGATARLVGHGIVLNGAFAAGCLLLLLRLAWPRRRVQENPRDLRALLALGGTYLVGTGALVVFATFPASRYIDSATLLLPVWPIYAGLRR